MREYMKKGKKGEKTWNQEEGGRLIVTQGGEKKISREEIIEIAYNSGYNRAVTKVSNEFFVSGRRLLGDRMYN